MLAVDRYWEEEQILVRLMDQFCYTYDQYREWDNGVTAGLSVALWSSFSSVAEPRYHISVHCEP